jgi:hypothetical protein
MSQPQQQPMVDFIITSVSMLLASGREALHELLLPQLACREHGMHVACILCVPSINAHSFHQSNA